MTTLQASKPDRGAIRPFPSRIISADGSTSPTPAAAIGSYLSREGAPPARRAGRTLCRAFLNLVWSGGAATAALMLSGCGGGGESSGDAVVAEGDIPVALAARDADAVRNPADGSIFRPGGSLLLVDLSSPSAPDPMPVAGVHPGLLPAAESGESTAVTRARLDSAAMDLETSARFVDVWTDPVSAGRDPDPDLAGTYDDVPTGAPAPADGIINDPGHVKSSWTANGSPDTCTECHDDNDPDDVMRLVGTITLPPTGGDPSHAVFETADGRQLIVDVGQMIGDCLLVAVGLRQVAMDCAHGSVTLTLRSDLRARPTLPDTTGVVYRITLPRKAFALVVDDRQPLASQVSLEPAVRDGWLYGYRVAWLESGGDLYRLGLRENDVVIRLNGTPAGVQAAFMHAVNGLRGHAALQLTVDRGGQLIDYSYLFD